jgi:hypothetical protein
VSSLKKYMELPVYSPVDGLLPGTKQDAGLSCQVKVASSELIVRKTLTGSSARVTGRPMTR